MRKNTERDALIASEFMRGVIIPKLAIRHGVTRQRIQQILMAGGIGRYQGGKQVIAMQNAHLNSIKKTNKRNEKSLSVYGCLHDEACKLTFALHLYSRQKCHARIRGIEWLFTLPSWYRVWDESGKWSLRGRGDGYVMARFNDEGPYSPNNVYICQFGKNVSDGHKFREKKSLLNR